MFATVPQVEDYEFASIVGDWRVVHTDPNLVVETRDNSGVITIDYMGFYDDEGYKCYSWAIVASMFEKPLEVITGQVRVCDADPGDRLSVLLLQQVNAALRTLVDEG